MAIESHIETLRERHTRLESQLHEMILSTSSDPVEITNLKRQKLQIKDRINKLQSGSA